MKKMMVLSAIIINLSMHAQVLAPVRGKITNLNSVGTSGEKIIFKGEQSGKEIVAVSDDAGEFHVQLPDGDIYRIMISSFIDQEEYSKIEVPKAPEGAKFTEIVLTIKFEHPQKLILKGIHFNLGSAELESSSKKILMKLVSFLKGKPNLRLQLTGHTDNIGDSSKNLLLSRQRAESVKNFLVANGCKASNLFTVGKGDLEPIADNNTPSGRKLNRRTVIEVMP